MKRLLFIILLAGCKEEGEKTISELVIPDRTTIIEEYQYQNRTDISKVSIPDSVTEIISSISR